MRPLALATVLVATDLSPSSDIALETAHHLANAAGAALHVVHVSGPRSPKENSHSAREARSLALAAVVRRAGIPERRAMMHDVSGSPADAIRAVSEDIRADVIVVGPPRGTNNEGQGRRLGGTARAIAAVASAPCLAALRRLPLPLERVLVPVDFSDTARGALLVGLSWASALRKGGGQQPGTTLRALHVSGGAGDPDNQRTPSLAQDVDSLRRSAGNWAGIAIDGETVSEDGSIVDAIARYAEDQRADLIVLGTRGLGLDAAERLGSISALVVERSTAPVLLVPPSVWREHLAD